MALPAQPLNFKPRGLYDALDGTMAPDGACYSLLNAVPDITTPGAWVPRPAATTVLTSADFPASTQEVSVMIAVGTRIYAMINRGAGVDKPFCWDFATNAQVPISIPGSLAAGAYPTTQAATGAWTPPTMDVVGTRILITHPGYDGATYFFGWLDLSNTNVAPTGTTNNASKVITAVSSIAGIAIGMTISAASGEIPVGSYITAFTATTITIDSNMTGTTAGTVLTIRGGGDTAPTAFPQYGAGQMNTQPLPSVATAVRQFNNRAYYACAQKLFFSDVLSPCVMTLATQNLTCGNSIVQGNNITAIGQLPLTNQLGGTVGSLIAFKQIGGYYQVRGDTATMDLVLNGPVGDTACLAPRTVTQTPAGLFFMGVDGIRIITFDGTLVETPIKGVRQPFANASVPSRACAAYNAGVYRISLQTLYDPVGGTTGFVDYWFDFKLQEWSGPHTFAYDCVTPMSNYFLLVSNQNIAKMFKNFTFTTTAPSYTELSSTYVWRVQTANLPQGDQMAVKNVIEMLVDVGFVGASPAPTYAISFYNDTTLLDGVNISGPGSGTTWTLQPCSVPWSKPLVYNKGNVRVSAIAATGQRIGMIRLRTEQLGYMNTVFPT